MALVTGRCSILSARARIREDAMVAAYLLLAGQDASGAPADPIVSIEGVVGGRPAIRGTRITVTAVKGRISGGDSIEDLMLDYPDVPRTAFEAALAHESEREPVQVRSPRPNG